MKDLPTHQHILLFEYKSLVALMFFDVLPLFLEQFDHRSFLILFYFEYLAQRHQIFILLLSKVDFEARQFDAQYLLMFLFVFLVIDDKVHIVDDREDSLPHSAILKGVALLHEGIIPQKSRIYHHWVLFVFVCAV